MSGFIDNTSNIDAAEIAAEYRTPDQGATAKSNSNVKWNDYRKMTPRANQSANVIAGASSQTMQAQDFGGPAGCTAGSNTYTIGSAKGSSAVTINGVFTSTAYASINTGTGASIALGKFGLGNQGGTSGISLNNVASFPNGTNLVGYGNRAASLGGVFFIITSGASGASNWTTLYHRALYPGGQFGVSPNIFYNLTSTFNRSDFTYSGSTFGGTETWQASTGFGGTIATAPLIGIYPFTVEFA